MKKNLVPLLFNLLFVTCSSFSQTIEVLQQSKPTSIRGLSVLDDNIAWISGSKGTVALTRDGGRSWKWQQVKGFENTDFRDIEAFSAEEAIIMSSGTPALLLKTTNGGDTWQEKYRKTDTSYFFDAMDFDTNRHGITLGDPVGGRFLLLETNDGGDTWQSFKNAPRAFKGEASFAASGTCLRLNGTITIVTGGATSRVLVSNGSKTNWASSRLPLTNGKQSRGAFSIAYGRHQSIIVGGDYQQDNNSDSVAFIQPKANSVYRRNLPVLGPSGFQSCVEYLWGDTFLSTGTAGSNITTNGGKTWKKIDTLSYNVCRKAKHGTLVLFGGNNGKIGAFRQ